MRRVRHVTFAVALAGCGAGAPGPLPKTPPEPARFAPGPALTPSAPLLEWLRARGAAERLRLPVVVRFDPHRLGVADAFVGTSDAVPPEDRVYLALDDSAMGIALADRLRQTCPAEAATCAVWLEGRWGALLPGAPADPARHPFSVFALADPQPEARAYAESAAD